MQICSPFGQGGSTQLRLSAWRPRGGYTAWSRTKLCSLIGTKGGVHADQLSVWPRGEYTASTLCLETKRGVHGLEPDQSLLSDWNQGGGSCRSALRLAKGGSTQLVASSLSAWRPKGGYTAWSRTKLCSLIGTKRGVHADLLSVWPRGEYTAWNQLSSGFLSEFAKRPVFGLWPEVGRSNPPLSLCFGPRGGYKALFSACNTKGGVHSSFLSL